MYDFALPITVLTSIRSGKFCNSFILQAKSPDIKSTLSKDNIEQQTQIKKSKRFESASKKSHIRRTSVEKRKKQDEKKEQNSVILFPFVVTIATDTVVTFVTIASERKFNVKQEYSCTKTDQMSVNKRHREKREKNIEREEEKKEKLTWQWKLL